MITLPPKEQQSVNALLSNSPTRCIGTYLIELPVGFKAYKEGNFYYKSSGDITITTKQQYLPPFKQMIALRQQELKNTKAVDPIDSPYLKAIYPVHTNQQDKIQGIIFERMESRGTADASRILEGYLWQDEVTLKIEMKARNGLAKQYDEDRLSSPRLYGNNVPQKLIELRKLFDRIKPRDDLTIPTTPGFCMFNSFMQGEDREWKDMNYGYRHESIDYFSFYFEFNDFADDYALLDKPEAYFTQGSGHTIYKGTRESHGLKLEEWVVKGKYFEDPQGDNTDDTDYIFTLGIHITDPTYKTPRLRIEMTYRIPEDETQGYTEEQLMLIWREITSSIRMRDSSFESK
ncbi:T6SS immunity protein Tli4 family protein [Orbus mooreae]|uniref:T6SS immunity protein Tli4 family protein n=1 Tax=Orbus mooreae TaxID=3074107 RepID=UPI00370D24E6